MRTDINKKYKLSKRYRRNNNDCILDKVKHILRPATPEEDVRQKTLAYLHKEMGIPFYAMDTEVPLTYFMKGQRGRMDIVVYGEKNGELVPVMVVETKAPQIPLVDEVYEQALQYALIADIDVLMVTNGHEMDIRKLNGKSKNYEPVVSVPSYDELLDPETIDAKPIEEFKYQRRDYKTLFKKAVITQEKDEGYFLGKDTSISEAPYYLNLAECFLDTSVKVNSLYLSNYTFVKDGGIRFTSFGNASGGSYPGLYRYFLLEDGNGSVQLVSFAVRGCVNGRTLLIVAVDDFDKHHNSLQLSLGHYSEIEKGIMRFFHNGRMTVGNVGPIKSGIVRDFVVSKTKFK